MSIYTQAVNALRQIVGFDSLADAFDELYNAETPEEIAAALGKIAVEVTVERLAGSAVRTAFSGIRLGLAVSGKIDRWEALSQVIGIGTGMSAGGLIDWINSLHPGTGLYDFLHPPKLAAQTGTIPLEPAPPETTIIGAGATGNTISGDLNPSQDYTLSPWRDAWGNVADGWGNIIGDGPSSDRADYIYETKANDLILAGGGNDTVARIYADGGEDVIYL